MLQMQPHLMVSSADWGVAGRRVPTPLWLGCSSATWCRRHCSPTAGGCMTICGVGWMQRARPTTRLTRSSRPPTWIASWTHGWSKRRTRRRRPLLDGRMTRCWQNCLQISKQHVPICEMPGVRQMHCSNRQAGASHHRFASQDGQLILFACVTERTRELYNEHCIEHKFPGL